MLRFSETAVGSRSAGESIEKERVGMNIELLKRLCETPGVPGREERVRALIEGEVADLFDSIETDAMGTLICRRDPRTAGKGKQSKKRSTKGEPRRLMQLCHMDEIGFYVRHVDDKGFLWLNNAGGFDPATCSAGGSWS
jgi:putative aminopeptidase FrvX